MDVKKADALIFQRALRDYFVYFKSLENTEAQAKAVVGYNTLLSLDATAISVFFGKEINLENYQFFDELVSAVTADFFIPTPELKGKYKVHETRKDKIGKEDSSAQDEISEKEIATIKQNLISEYPHLNRTDLVDQTKNYVVLTIKIRQALKSSTASSQSVKNLIESQTKLGSYLGIDEGEKSRIKGEKSKESIASLSKQFEETLREWPAIEDKWKYEELCILLQKLDRGELSKELFEGIEMAGMKVEDARLFIAKRESKYE